MTESLIVVVTSDVQQKVIRDSRFVIVTKPEERISHLKYLMSVKISKETRKIDSRITIHDSRFTIHDYGESQRVNHES